MTHLCFAKLEFDATERGLGCSCSDAGRLEWKVTGSAQLKSSVMASSGSSGPRQELMKLDEGLRG